MTRVWLDGSGPGLCDLDVAAWPVDAMHAAIRAFAKIDFASYLYFGELDHDDLCQLCSKEEELVSDGGADGAAST